MCNSCEVLYINGVKCHETGCPEAWKDQIFDCIWCGTEFTPEYKGQDYCSESCFLIDSGLDYMLDNEDEND